MPLFIKNSQGVPEPVLTGEQKKHNKLCAFLADKAEAHANRTVKRYEYKDISVWGHEWNKVFHSKMDELTKDFRIKFEPKRAFWEN